MAQQTSKHTGSIVPIVYPYLDIRVAGECGMFQSPNDNGTNVMNKWSKEREPGIS